MLDISSDARYLKMHGTLTNFLSYFNSYPNCSAERKIKETRERETEVIWLLISEHWR
jgi:hypothetical protein